MRIVCSDEHRWHHSAGELTDGIMKPAVEMPSRAEAIKTALMAAELGTIEEAREFGRAPIVRVHDPEFVAFLMGAHEAWRARHDSGDALPLSFMAPGMRRRKPSDIDGQLGYFCFDCGTPITAGTWRAATANVDIALTAAAVVTADEPVAFALCRPPGHHAGSDFYGGYCYLNNAAIAAQYLLDQGAARVAILDVDYHHGNGTQEIFYERDDVLFVSIHADPANEYPFFAGYADETGVGTGADYNLNLPLPPGTAWAGYHTALAVALDRIDAFAAEVLVISFGADTFVADPIAEFSLQRDDFARMGAAIAARGGRTVIVMEGGYAVADLGANVVAFLSAWTADRG